MALEYPNILAAAAIVEGATGALTRNLGFASAIRNAAGIYTLTFDQELAEDEAIAHVTPLSTNAPPLVLVIPTILRPGPTAITVSLLDPSLQATDSDFYVSVFALTPLDS